MPDRLFRHPEAFKNAVRGRLYRLTKQAATYQLDADAIVWLKRDGDGYLTRVSECPGRMPEELAQS